MVTAREAAACDPAAIDLIDVRTPGEYAAVHAMPARLAPPDRLDREIMAAIGKGATRTPIYLICKSGKRAQMAAEKFAAAGIEVTVVVGGTDAWSAAGLPVVRGHGVISLERQVRIAAGLIVLLGAVLGLTVDVGFVWLSALVGAGLVFAGMTDYCGMALLLGRLPWNRGGNCKP
jgi:rhodanese-related sulfurtransferase